MPRPDDQFVAEISGAIDAVLADFDIDIEKPPAARSLLSNLWNTIRGLWS